MSDQKLPRNCKIFPSFLKKEIMKSSAPKTDFVKKDYKEKYLLLTHPKTKESQLSANY